MSERTFENLVFVTAAAGFARSAKRLQDISTAMLRMTWAKAGETGGVAA